MVRVGHAVLAAAMMAAMGKPVAAEVLDATYRGTMVCDKLPFTSQQTREAIEVTISGGAVRYNHVVRLRNGKQIEIPFNYRDVLKGDNAEQNIKLEAGDTIVVP